LIAMNPMRLLALAACSAMLLASSELRASTTHAIGVSAVVVSAGNCRFDTAGPTALSFGAIDQASSANQTASVGIGFRCTGGGASPTIAWSVTSDDGLYVSGPAAPRMRHAVNPGAYLRYSLNMPASGTSPKNSNQTLTVTGTITPADFQNAAAGAYADTVVLTIAP
jgi:spore coat protein U-like protein